MSAFEELTCVFGEHSAACRAVGVRSRALQRTIRCGDATQWLANFRASASAQALKTLRGIAAAVPVIMSDEIPTPRTRSRVG